MTTDLYIYPFSAWDEYRDVFRRAKQGDTSLVSVQLMPKAGFPGCGRVLAFGCPPPFAADSLVIRKKPEDLPNGVVVHLLRWYVGLDVEPREMTVADWLSMTLGRKAVEVG